MTEAEALTKACFKAATFGGSQQLADGPGPNCIASACMAWRGRLVPMRENYGWDADGNPKPIREGYCGLAGAQQ